MITLYEAKIIADKSARLEINWIPIQPSYLSKIYLERKYCWIFFADENLPKPPNGYLGFTAFAVSKKGNVRDVYDLRDDIDKMSDFADKMSDYFFRNDE